jgi:hypothetical protein
LDFGLGATRGRFRDDVARAGLPDNDIMAMAAAERSKSKIENPKSKMNPRMKSLHIRGA